MNKFKRTKFMKSHDVDGNIECDIVDNYWTLFEIKRSVSYYRITWSDVERPDLLSIKLYGAMKYWWILLKVNNIDDIWNDMVVGDIITVPNVNDFEDWLLKVTSSKRSEEF